MVRVQFSHAFDHSDEFWIILKLQPALVDSGIWRFDRDDPSAASIVRGLVPLFGIGSLGVGPRVFIFGKRAAPAIGED